VTELKALSHLELVRDFKRTFFFCDLVFIGMILLNVCAVGVTSYYVSRAMPTQPAVEVSFIQAAVNDYQGIENIPQEEVRKFVLPIIFQFLLWGIFATIYVWRRTSIYKHEQLVQLALLLAVAFVLILFDFSNNIGFMMGRI
jgi:hypothetical protein